MRIYLYLKLNVFLNKLKILTKCGRTTIAWALELIWAC